MSTHPWPMAVPHDPMPGVGTDALLAALDALDTGVLVCDARGRLLVCNHAARRELDAGGLLRGPLWRRGVCLPDR